MLELSQYMYIIFGIAFIIVFIIRIDDILKPYKVSETPAFTEEELSKRREIYKSFDKTAEYLYDIIERKRSEGKTEKFYYYRQVEEIKEHLIKMTGGDSELICDMMIYDYMSYGCDSEPVNNFV